MINKEKNFVSAVIYVRNAEHIIKDFVLHIARELDKNFQHSEIICVNDASTDESVARLRLLENEVENVSITLLSLNRFHGKEAAMQGGLGLTVGDFVFEFDEVSPDIDVKDMMRLYTKSLEGFDIVAAVTGKTRGISSKLFYKLFNKSADIPYELMTEYFRILSRRAINRIGSLNRIITYRKVAYASSGLKYATIEIAPVKTLLRESREERRFRRYLAADSVLMFTNLGFKFSVLMTGLMMVVMVGIVVYALISRGLGITVPGWTSTVLLVAFGFFGLFGILSIITKYLQLLMDVNVRKSAFTFESIEKITRDGR
ncbi:MAG: glycosyltransferase [Lachnospiraceae bacterium]|jgi:glycosyltransferase involved in cell wall biosynthesis